ncbi:MAG: 6-phosphogluconolactonase [Candidatus Anoxychlamydiales bacterium]|nr:6-phosphogluconolactonase [Candidatus Anoxychlamydiales bacterium]
MIKTFDTKNEIDNFLINYFKELSNKEIEKKGSFNIALSGGSTPLSFYEKLALEKDISWDNIYIFFVDERMVSNQNIKSNIYQIKKALIDPLKLENVFYINKEIDLEDSKLEYELLIKAHFKEEVPSFDFVLLGIGDDGHTASIFPNSKLIEEKKDLIGIDQKIGDNFFRMSFTFPLINNSKNIVFLAIGENKKFMIKKILIDKDKSIVATRVRAKENLMYLLNKKSSSLINF